MEEQEQQTYNFFIVSNLKYGLIDQRNCALYLGVICLWQITTIQKFQSSYQNRKDIKPAFLVDYDDPCLGGDQGEEYADFVKSNPNIPVLLHYSDSSTPKIQQNIQRMFPNTIPFEKSMFEKLDFLVFSSRIKKIVEYASYFVFSFTLVSLLI